MAALQVVTVEGATHWGGLGVLIRPEFAASLRQFIAAHRGVSPQALLDVVRGALLFEG
jgi:hypothetical protein